jgi:hypothetical protein
VQYDAVTHAKQIDALFVICLAVIDRFDRERITNRFGGLIESDAMVAPVARGFDVVPFEASTHKYTDYQ